MKASTWVTVGQLAIAVGGIGVGIGAYFKWPVVLIAGLIIIAAGTFGVFHFGKKADEDKERETFQKSLHFHRLEGFWVEVLPEVYKLGIAATILNKDAMRAVTFGGLGFRGRFSITGGTVHLKEIKAYDAPVTVTGQYYLSAGQEQVIYVLLPAEVKMKISGGTANLTFDGTWVFLFEGAEFEVSVPTVNMNVVLTIQQWVEKTGG